MFLNNLNDSMDSYDFLNSTHEMNETNSAPGATVEEESTHIARDIFLIVLYTITGILAFYGNYLVCRIIFDRNSALRNSTNILVGNLAISDLLCAITIFTQWFFCSKYALDNWKMEFPCALIKSTQVLTFYMSSLIMMLIAIERFMSIMFPLSPPLRSKLVVTIAWIATTLFVASSLGSAKVFEYFTGDRIISCRIVLVFELPIPFTSYTFHSNSMRATRVWGIWIGQYVLPLLVTGILYALIARRVWMHKKAGISTEASKDARDAKKKRIVIMLIVVVIVFALCWLPLHALNFTDFVIRKLEKGKVQAKKSCNSDTLYFLLYWLGISSCCYNPFIYWWMNPEFRRGFKNLMPKIITKFMSTEYSTSDQQSVELRRRPGTELTNST